MPSARVTIRSPPSSPSERTLHGTVIVRAEALGLEQRVLGQLRAGDPRREAEVVLDPRAGTGLAARGELVGGEHVEALGRRVHRRGETGRPRADDDEVVHVVPVHVAVRPRAARRTRRCVGFFLNLPPRPITTGVSAGVNLNCAEQVLGLGVRLDIHPV